MLRRKLPGAAKFRYLLKKEKSHDKTESKQTGRKGKTRPRKKKFSLREKAATHKYSGKRKRSADIEPLKKRRRKDRSNVVPGDELQSVEELQELGFLLAPGRCPSCKRGNL